jgi:hypothetical protein
MGTPLNQHLDLQTAKRTFVEIHHLAFPLLEITVVLFDKLDASLSHLEQRRKFGGCCFV